MIALWKPLKIGASFEPVKRDGIAAVHQEIEFNVASAVSPIAFYYSGMRHIQQL